MNNTEISGSSGPLYKIGTGWVFNMDTYTGYEVTRAGNKRDSNVTGFIEAFNISKEGDSYNVRYEKEIPIGIIRKAIHLIELHESGELVKLGDKFK